jgi:hypothetical protein
MNDDYEIIANDEPSLEDYPALTLVPELTLEDAVSEFDTEDEEEEEQARPNRRVIRAAKRAGRLHGAGWTRKWRKGREAKPW